jgi:hypothetical protein
MVPLFPCFAVCSPSQLLCCSRSCCPVFRCQSWANLCPVRWRRYRLASLLSWACSYRPSAVCCLLPTGASTVDLSALLESLLHKTHPQKSVTHFQWWETLKAHGLSEVSLRSPAHCSQMLDCCAWQMQLLALSSHGTLGPLLLYVWALYEASAPWALSTRAPLVVLEGDLWFYGCSL